MEAFWYKCQNNDKNSEMSNKEVSKNYISILKQAHMLTKLILIEQFLHIFKCATIKNSVLFLPEVQLNENHLSINKNNQKSLLIKFTLFTLALRLTLETLIYDEHLRDEIMHKRKIECLREKWFKKMREKVFEHYINRLRQIFSVLEISLDVYDKILTNFEKNIDSIFVKKYINLEVLDYNQIICSIEKSIYTMLDNTSLIYESDSTVLEELYFFCMSLASYKFCLEIGEECIALSHVTMFELNFYQKNNEFTYKIIKQFEMNIGKHVFNLNLNKLFLDLLNLLSKTEVENGRSIIVEIRWKQIFTKFSSFCKDFIKNKIVKCIFKMLNTEEQNILIFIDFNRNHLKLFFKLYLCHNKDLKQTSHFFIDKICNMLLTWIGYDTNEKIKFIIESEKTDIMMRDYSNSSFGTFFNPNFKKNHDTLQRISRNRDSSIYHCTKKILGDEIAKHVFNDQISFLNHIYLNIGKYQNFYVKNFDEKAAQIFLECKPQVINFLKENIEIIYIEIRIFCSYVLFYNILMSREEKDNDYQIDHNRKTQKNMSDEKTKAYLSKIYISTPTEHEKNRELKFEEYSNDINPQNKEESTFSTQECKITNNTTISLIPTESVNKATTNPMKKQKKKIITKEEQLKKNINAERAIKTENKKVGKHEKSKRKNK